MQVRWPSSFNLLMAWMPLTANPVRINVGLTAFADDLNQIHVAPTAAAAEARIDQASVLKEEVMRPAGLHENCDKQEIVPCFYGPTQHLQTRRLRGGRLRKRVKRSARYLGGIQAHCARDNEEEIEARSSAMTGAW